MSTFGEQSKPYPVPAIICDAEKLAQVAVIQELGKHEAPLVLISKYADARGFASRYAGQRRVADCESHQNEYIDYLIENIPKGVIFPSNDANAENLSKNKHKLLSAGFRLLVADYEVMQTVVDKYQLYLTTQKCSIKCPRSLRINTRADLLAVAEKGSFPLIIKSTHLAGGVYRLVKRKEDLEKAYGEMIEEINSPAHAQRHSQLIIQEWIDPAEVTLWNFNACVKAGEILCYAMGRRIRTDVRPDGTSGSMLLFGETQFDEEIFNANKRLLKYLNYEGIVETEWSLNGEASRLYLYDFNPRPAGNLRWVLRSGVPLADCYYRACLDRPSVNGIAMKEGVKYYKIFYENNDFVFAVNNPRYSFRQVLAILRENFFAVMTFRKHAIDIFEVSDLRPTIKELKLMLLPLLKALIKLFLRPLFHMKPSRSNQ